MSKKQADLDGTVAISILVPATGRHKLSNLIVHIRRYAPSGSAIGGVEWKDGRQQPMPELPFQERHGNEWRTKGGENA